MAGNVELHLASASPRRRELLGTLRLEFTWAGVDIDESPLADEAPADMVLRLATLKASAGAAASPDARVVIGSDTAVVLEEHCFGKPRDQADAAAMLAALSGRTHDVLTGVAVLGDGRLQKALSRSAVTFRDIDPEEARHYWHSGEPVDKAGGYAIQGLGGVFVAAIAGSYSGVVGLPVYETAALLAHAGIPVLSPGCTHIEEQEA
ncbi:MAG: Maf family protein [Woeseiaceae bacterium]|nr:Maf family protein [Woeseiaceae bacterium]